VLCIPGPWADRNDFNNRLRGYEPKGRYFCAVMMLADVQEKDYLSMEFHEYEGNLSQAFFMASKGKISSANIEQLSAHKNCVYLRLPADVEAQKSRLLKYSGIIRDLGGYAVKVEPSGPAHEWGAWFAALPAQNAFYRYNLFVMLTRDNDYYFSCGMRYFGMPDVEVPINVETNEATAVMNQFNFWQISEHPRIETGLTYSLTPASSFYFIEAQPDHRYKEEDPLRNPQGVWRLTKKNEADFNGPLA